MTSPLDPIKTLRRLLEEGCAPLGLDLNLFAVVVDRPGEPDHIEVAFKLVRERLSANEEGLSASDFDQMMQGTAGDHDPKVEQTKDALRDLFKDLGD